MRQLGIGILLLTISLSEGLNSYLVTSSEKIIPGVPLDVRVTILTSSHDVTVEAAIEHASNSSTVVKDHALIRQGLTDTIHLKIPEGLLKSSYKLVVQGTGGLTFHNESSLIYDDDWPLVYIQTDKTRYSAGQELKFRAIFLQPTFLGYNGDVIVNIFDGKSNKVHMVGPVKPRNGVLSGILQLSSEPAYGDWVVQALAGTKSSTKTIKVNDYVLPKFSVTISLPSEISRTDSVIPVDVLARFTFNADVYGNCTLEIYNSGDVYNFLMYSKQIIGKVHFDVPMAEMSAKLNLYGTVNMRALVTDNATQLTMVVEEQINFKSDGTTSLPSISITQVDNVKQAVVPGTYYYTTIFVGRDDTPLGTKGSVKVAPSITTAEVLPCNLNSPPTQWLDVKTTDLTDFFIDFDESGFAPLFLHVPLHTETVEIQLEFGTATASISLRSVPLNAPVLLSISPSKPHAVVGDTIVFGMEATSALNGTLLVEVLSRGVIVDTQRVNLRGDMKKHVPIYMSPKMVPRAFVVFSHVTQHGNLISDFAVIHVDGSPFGNNVTVTFSRTTLQPGEPVSLTISADPNSTVYVLSEDKKNRLLGSENDIYFNEIAADLNARIFPYERNTNSFTNARTLSMSDYRVFDMTISGDFLSNNQSIPKKCVHITTLPPGVFIFPTWIPGTVPTPAPGFTFAPFYIPTPAPGRTYAPVGVPTTTQEPAHLVLGTIVRSLFPETWIWDEYSIGPSGYVVINDTIPDSITSWITSVFVTNDLTGFGISELKQTLTVKKDFFVTMDVPSTIVVGEEFLLQLTVFNYMQTIQQVFIQVTTSENPNNPTPVATTVNPGKGHSTFLHITPKNIGVLKINVIARAGFFTGSTMDTLEREVVVKPNGVHRKKNEQHFVGVSPSGAGFSKIIQTTDPPNMVRGTKTVTLKFTGNYMVPSIDGLQNLINMPYGCGEQNMLNFAPDIYIAKYLKSVGKLTDDVLKKSERALLSGLQRELTYQHTDGSFSAFGNRDSSGSSWLTAFVMKCFRQADGLIQIDDSILRKAMTWLIRYQKPDGSFTEPGRVIHTAMQAGTSAGLKLTAFILNAVLENKDLNGFNKVKITDVIQKGQTYLETRLQSITDMYTLAIVCYSLAKTESHMKSTCLTKMEATKQLDGDKMYWEASSHLLAGRSVGTRAAKTRAPAKDIEATAYGLLAYIEMGQIAGGLSIVKWLVSQRNPYGGFESTQDTVISLQALSAFSSGDTSNDPNYNVAFNVYGSFQHFYNITPLNKDAIHEVEAPGAIHNVIVVAMGNGAAVIDVTTSYYITGLVNHTTIEVNATLPHESLNSVTVRPCIRWQGSATSGMLVAVVEMPTGFVSDVDKLNAQSVVKRHETNGREVALYFDGVGSGQQVCADVTMVRSDPVVKSQACHITAYDYYNPINQAMTSYDSGILKRSNICDVCPLCQFCQGSTGVGLIGVGK